MSIELDAAKARALGAIADKTLAEAQKARAEAAKAEITLERERRDEEEELALNKYHYVYTFSDQVTSVSVKSCMDQLTMWSRTKPDCAIEIVFNSPGGDVTEGMALFDFIQLLKKQGHYITTTALGMAASMAGILLQAGHRRIMGAEAWLLIHEASFGAFGKMGEIEDRVKWVEAVQRRILKIFAERSKMSEASIAAKWKRKDWWLSSDECLKLGFIDEIL